MKKITIYIVLTLFISVQMNGQALKSSYFLDNATTRHTLNPALAPVQGYVGMPLLSSLGVNLEGNFGVSNFLFPLKDGGLGTFLHPEVTSSEFLDPLRKMSSLDFNFNYDIFNMGWNRGKSSFWTIDLGLRLDVNSSIPKEFFSLLKKGMHSDQTSYSIKNFSLAQDAYAQVGVGYSMDIEQVKGLRVGGKLKFLVGIDNIEVSMSSVNLNMSVDKWSVDAQGHARILGKGVGFEKDENGVFDGLETNPSEIGIGGFGAAIDLGAEYKFPEGSILDGLAVSASVTDLGFISYSSSSVSLAEAELLPLVFDGVDAISDIDILDLVSMKVVEVDKGYTKMLSANVHLGVEYSFLNDLMSAGLLYSGSYAPLFVQNELTLAYNLTPTDWFGLVLSYSFLNTQRSFGWLLNFTPRRGVNFFLGSDYTIFSFTPQLIPVYEAFLNVQFGISFPIGANNIRGKNLFTRNHK